METFHLKLNETQIELRINYDQGRLSMYQAGDWNNRHKFGRHLLSALAEEPVSWLCPWLANMEVKIRFDTEQKRLLLYIDDTEFNQIPKAVKEKQ